MTIRIKAPDGSYANFPDGTPDAVIEKAMQEAFPLPKGPTAVKAAPSGFNLDNLKYMLVNGAHAVDDTVRGISRGVTGNWSDEIAAGIGALYNGKDYQTNLRGETRDNRLAQARHPVLTGTGQTVGTIAQTLLGAKALGAVKTAVPVVDAVLARTPTWLQAAGAGGAQGALAGAGEGDTAASKAKGAKTGALTGAALGGGAAALTNSMSPIVAHYVDTFMGGNKGVTRETLSQVLGALKQDGYDMSKPSSVAALRAEVRRYGGKPVSLADVGTATRARTGVALRTPNPAQSSGVDSVLSRQAGSGERLAADVKTSVSPRTDVHTLDDALIAQRKETALPLRRTALNEPNPDAVIAPEQPDAGVNRLLGQPNVALPMVPQAKVMPRVVDDPVLQQLTRLPMAQQALGRARLMAEQQRGRLAIMAQLPGKAGADAAAELETLPNLAPGQPLDMHALDYMKRHLDSEVDAAYRSTDSAVRAQAPELEKLRNGIRDRMREVVPEYGQYLDAYSGTSAMRGALHAGRGGPAENGLKAEPSFAAQDPEVIAAGQAARTPAEQELYRVGAARKLTDTVNTTTDKSQPADRLLNTPEARSRLAATGVSGSDMEALLEKIRQEQTMGKLTKEIGGADARGAARDAAEVVGLGVPMNPGNPVAWAMAGVRKGLDAVSLAKNSKINAALLPRMLEQNPAAVDKIISELEAAGQKAQAAALRRQVQAIRQGGVLGGIIGAPVTIREDQ